MMPAKNGRQLMGVKVREKVPGSGVFWVFINHGGKRTSRKVGSEGAAGEVARQLEARLTLGDFGIIDGSKKTFKDVAESWLKSFQDWKKTTPEIYRKNLNKHIYPTFKNRQIAAITRTDVKRFMSSKSHYKAGTLRIFRAILSGVMVHAMDQGLIKTSPVDHISIKERRRYNDANPLSESDAQKLLDAAQLFMEGHYYPHFLFMLRTGVRAGELLAIKWPKIDLEAGAAMIDETVWRGVTDKTKTSRDRRVNLSPLLVETLSGMTPKKGLVFRNKKGTPLHIETLRNALERCLESAKLKHIRLHDLRHTYATIRLLRGHDPWDVSKQLGHSSIQMTYDIYGHWIPSKFKDQTDALDGTPDAP